MHSTPSPQLLNTPGSIDIFFLLSPNLCLESSHTSQCWLMLWRLPTSTMLLKDMPRSMDSVHHFKPATQVLLLLLFFLVELSFYLSTYFSSGKINSGKIKNSKNSPLFFSWLTTHLIKEWWLEPKHNIKN